MRCETPFEALTRDILSSDDEATHQALAAAFADDGEDVPSLTEHERHFSWVSEIAEAVGWRPEFRYRAKLTEHINLKEARAYRTCVRRRAADAKAHGKRHLVFKDSAVVRGAVFFAPSQRDIAAGRAGPARGKPDVRFIASTDQTQPGR